MPNRLPDVLAITIKHHGEPLQLDPNRLAMMSLRPNVFHTVLKPIWKEQSDISELSPAVVYKDHEGEVRLTVDELTRFAGIRLRPHEYFALRRKFGSRFMWHDDYYDELTGKALQPRETNPF